MNSLAITYDSKGQMEYNPDFHENHKEKFTEYELEYLCKYFKIDGLKTISLALGRTEATVKAKVKNLRKQGLYEYYRDRSKYW